MELHLDPDEASVLEEMLVHEISDLRSEIVGTDNPSFRRGLKSRRESVARILERMHTVPAR